ncbi:MAG: cyclic nucleotide-binding domain-containing protein [Chloroflexota bacterium]
MDQSLQQTPSDAPGFWAWLKGLLRQVGEAVAGPTSLRLRLKESADPLLFRPQVRADVTVRRLEGHAGRLYVLKNPQAGTYLRLNQREFDLWRLMDGSRTVRELMVIYFQRHKALAFGLITGLVQALRDGHFLTQPPVKVYEQARTAVAARRPVRWSERLVQSFFHREFVIGGLDAPLRRLYRAGLRLLFAPPMLILLALLALGGLAAFFLALEGGAATYAIFKLDLPGLPDSLVYLLGFLALYVANLLTIFLHELAHALTTKHFGREVHRGGFMVYWGLPAFFVDTQDIWLEPKGARIAVSLAGPLADFVVGGVCALAAFFLPHWGGSVFLFKMAFMAYASILMNLNPLLELDGYFILSDWLDMPNLRARSLDFVRRQLWPKLRQRQSLNREERIYAVFGVLCAVYAVVALYLSVYLWQRQIARMFGELWASASSAVRALLVLLAAAALIPLLLAFVVQAGRLLSRWARWLARQGILDRPGALAGLSFAGWLLLLGLSRYLPADWRDLYRDVLPVALLLLTLAFLIGAARYYGGSGFVGVFGALGLAVALLLACQTLYAVWLWDVPWLRRLAFLPLLIAAFMAFQQNGMAHTSRLEKALMLIFLGAAFLVTLPAVLWTISAAETTGQPLSIARLLAAAAPPYLGMLAQTLLVPTFFAFLGTRFNLSWGLFLLATVGLVAQDLILAFDATSPLPLPGLWLAPAVIAGLLLVAFVLYYLIHLRAIYHRQEWPARESLSDQDRLRSAFGRFFEGLFAQFQDLYGRRLAQVIDDRLDVAAVTAEWSVVVDRGRLRDARPWDGVSLADQADDYRQVLNFTVDLMDDLAGKPFLRRAILAAYDSLPWQEREVLGRHVLAFEPWGEGISHEFQTRRDDYRLLLRAMPLFAGCAEADIDALVAALRSERLPAGRQLIRQGERGEEVYLVRSGEVEVWRRAEDGREQLVDELRRGDYCGEYVLLRGEPYDASYRTSVDSELLVMSRHDFNRLVRDRLEMREQVERSAGAVALLARMPVFADLNHMALSRLAARFRKGRIGAGEVLIRQGQRGRAFFVVVEGSLTVIAERGTPQQRVLARLGVGEYAGEISLLLDQPAIATVVGGPEGAVLLGLLRDDFEAFVRTHSQAIRRLEQVGSGRMLDTRRKLGLSSVV